MADLDAIIFLNVRNYLKAFFFRRRNLGFNNRGLFRNQLNQLDRLNQLKQRILLRNLGKTTNRNRNGPRLNPSPEKPKIVYVLECIIQQFLCFARVVENVRNSIDIFL